MSENKLILIPTNPHYIPNALAQEEARGVFASFVPLADEVNIQVTTDVAFIATGGNLESIVCSVCGTPLNMDWWLQAMDTAYNESTCTHLERTMPCCGTTSSFNDLQYAWPAGFARFRLEARNPNTDLTEDAIHSLERILKWTLRKIWAHF